MQLPKLEFGQDNGASASTLPESTKTLVLCLIRKLMPTVKKCVSFRLFGNPELKLPFAGKKKKKKRNQTNSGLVQPVLIGAVVVLFFKREK